MPPGNTLKVELLTVTPAGKPLMLPLTSWLKPLIGLTESCTCCCTVGMRERLAGCKDKEMPGGPVTVSWNCVEGETDPPEPFTVIVEFPAPAVPAALNWTCCVPEPVKVKLDGDAVTPAGNPEKDTEIVPLNPLRGWPVTVTVAVPPGYIETVEGLALRM